MTTVLKILRLWSPKESLERSLKEMQLIRQGKLKKRFWKDLKKDLKTNDDVRNNISYK